MRIYIGLAISPWLSPGCPSRAQTLSPILTTVHNFTGSGTNGTGCTGCDGSVPLGGVIIGSGNLLYGTTQYGGSFGYGTVFALTAPATPGGTWTETILHDFSYADGTNPSGPLAAGSDGVLYGTTQYGGNPVDSTHPARPGSTILQIFCTGRGSEHRHHSCPVIAVFRRRGRAK